MVNTAEYQVDASEASDGGKVECIPDVLVRNGGKSSETRLTFLHLPAEIRNAIYHLALVAGPTDSAQVKYAPLISWEDRYNGAALPVPAVLPKRLRYYCDNTRKSFVVSHDPAAIKTLVQPGVTRVSRKIRAECLPIYYGENHFKLRIPPQGRGDREDKWYRFVKMMRTFSTSGPGGKGTSWLRFIRRISVVYEEVIQHFDEGSNYGSDQEQEPEDRMIEHRIEIGFKNVVAPARRNITTHIGDDELNWKDGSAVREAFRKALKQKWSSHRAANLEEHVPVERVADALCMIGMECPMATEWMKVTCLCPHDEICWKHWKESKYTW